MQAHLEVVGGDINEIIALPIQFPPPVINFGEAGRGDIRMPEGHFEEHVILMSAYTTYELGRILANAIFGQVRHGWILNKITDGVFERTGEQVAIKIYLRSNLEQQTNLQENPMQEISCMQFLNFNSQRHDNIITHIECLKDRGGNIYNIMEFYEGGELYNVVSNFGALEEPRARHFFLNIVRGLEFLQTMGVCHRDMSLENLLVSGDRVVINDLGMCLRVPRHPETGVICLMPPQGRCGKKNYISPEVYANNQPFNGLLVDMWALGVILFILVCGVPPFDFASPLDDRYRMVRSGNLGDMLRQWRLLRSREVIDLLQKMLNPIPKQRLTIEEILAHPWMQG